MITKTDQTNDIIKSGHTDLIFISREFLREVYWALKAESALDAEAKWPTPCGYVIKRRKR